MKYIAPTVFAPSYTCPHCSVIAGQNWWMCQWSGQRPTSVIGSPKDKYPVRVGMCHHCQKSSIWVDDELVFPDNGNAPLPNTEMPPEVLKLYNEASSINPRSPKGAAALLRLAIQVLCIHLGESGKNINSDIGNLVKKGLPEVVQQSLDIVRVTGNDAVHPGQIDTDNPETVDHLFELINVIVEYMIALPNRISGIYKSLPADKIKGIKDRDGT